MPVQRGQDLVQPGGAIVIQQQADAHSAVGRLVQRLQQHGACHVAMPDVVLHIQAAFGRARQHHARGESVVGVGQRVDAGFARVGRRQRGDGLAQRRGERFFGSQRMRHAAPVQRGQGTASQKCAEGGHE
ncbi:hypothetical protein D3C72_1523190 [compost metagenome]